MILRNLTPAEINLAKMIEIYRKAETNIKNELTRKKTLGLVDFADKAALKRVQMTLAEMTAQVEENAPIYIESFFGNTAESLITTRQGVVATLVNNYLGKVEEAAEITLQSAGAFLAVGRLEAGAIRDVSLQVVAEKEARGVSWRAVQKKMAIDLQNKGVTAFVDKAGHEWNLTAYCSMLTRTTARQAQVASILTEDDWDLWQIIAHPSCCALCSAYSGRVYSKSGLNPDYPPLSSAFGKIDSYGMNDLTNTYLNIHPNCLCTLARYTEAGKTDEEIQKDKDFSSFENRPVDDYRTQKERDEYREKEKARAEYRATRKQYEKYKTALGSDFPKTFQTFEKHKKLNDDVYKGWKAKVRQIDQRAKETQEIINEVLA